MKIKTRIFYSLSAIITLLLFYSYLESRWLKVTEHVITSRDVPVSFNGTRIVFVSDIHHGPYFSRSRVAGMVERINRLHPDLIILGGDYVHRSSSYILPLFDELRKLQAPLGIYAVLGNHDYWADARLTREMMVRNGINTCENKSYWIKRGDSRIKVGGVGDWWESTQNLAAITEDVKEPDFCILISHNPDYPGEIKTELVDLTFSGHTHGGQVTLFGLWAPLVPSQYGQKYRYGLVTSGKMKSYISSGVGTITPPVRFFCRPEIVVITLQNGPASAQ